MGNPGSAAATRAISLTVSLFAIVERMDDAVIPSDSVIREAETSMSKYRGIRDAARGAKSATQLLLDTYVKNVRNYLGELSAWRR